MLAPPRPLIAWLIALAIPSLLVACVSPRPPTTAEPTIHASPTTQPTARLTPAPTASAAAATPHDELVWIPIAEGRLLELEWAPDGRHVAVVKSDAAGPTGNQAIDIVDLDGQTIHSFQGADEIVWLDTERFVVSTWQRRTNGDGTLWEVAYQPNGYPEAQSQLAFLGSDELTLLGTNLAGAKSNGYGVLAFPPRQPRAFGLWTVEGGASESVPGVPVRWSAAGDRLLVEYPLGDAPYDPSAAAILSVPGLDVIYSSEDASFGTDPALRRVFEVDESRLTMTDLDTGKTTAVESVGTSVIWHGDERFVVLDYDTASATVHTLVGDSVATYENVGNHVSTSVDGSTHVFWYFDQVENAPNPIAVLRDGVLRRLQTPGQMDVGPGPVVSPDGSALAAVVHVEGRTLAFVARL